MQNTLVLTAAFAVVVAVVATVFALRAGRRARRAADLVAQLLDPPVVVSVEASPTSAALAASPPVPVPPSAPPLEALPLEALPLEALPLETLPVETAAVPALGAPAASPELVPALPPGDRQDLVAPLPPPLPRIPVLDLDRLRAWLTMADVELGRLAIVSVELDNLGEVRHRMGDAAGVDLLGAITARLRTVTRPRDVVAHVNQDRFVLVCRDVPDQAAAEALAERISMGVAHPAMTLSGVAEVTASIGLALATDVEERPESVLRRAIKAGQHARSLGGARIEISTTTPSMSIGALELTAALARDELRLHYQPIVSCATGRVAGFEALLRWEHPEHGLLSAGEFLPEVERSGAIIPIGTWAIEHACRQMAEWHDRAGSPLKLDLNLSPRQFAEPALAPQVKRILRDTGLAPGSLWLEITEETLLGNREIAGQTLGRLHEIGVGLVIDDFGTGASSLVSLQQLPLDAIKIASTFVAEVGNDRDRDGICRAIVDLAHSLGLGAIAEGVETLEQFAALRALDCELAQGHLFGAARPAEEWGEAPAATLGVVRGPDAG